MTDDITVHHILFPKGMWQYSDTSNNLRTAFTVELTRSEHDELNAWIHQTIGYIPPIPPPELSQVHKLMETTIQGGSLKSRLSDLLAAIRQVAATSKNYTIRMSLNLTHRNLQRQIRYLDAHYFLTRKIIPATPQAPLYLSDSIKIDHYLHHLPCFWNNLTSAHHLPPPYM